MYKNQPQTLNNLGLSQIVKDCQNDFFIVTIFNNYFTANKIFLAPTIRLTTSLTKITRSKTDLGIIKFCSFLFKYIVSVYLAQKKYKNVMKTKINHFPLWLVITLMKSPKLWKKKIHLCYVFFSVTFCDK